MMVHFTASLIIRQLFIGGKNHIVPGFGSGEYIYFSFYQTDFYFRIFRIRTHIKNRTEYLDIYIIDMNNKRFLRILLYFKISFTYQIDFPALFTEKSRIILQHGTGIQTNDRTIRQNHFGLRS